MSKTLCPALLASFHDDGCTICLNDPDVVFFYNHAGWGYNPVTETAEQGRWRTARMLAASEDWGEEVGLTFDWSDDWDVGNHHAYYGEAYDEGEPSRCERCVATLDDHLVASLGCIDDASPEYVRVIQAELADEALDEVLGALEGQFRRLLVDHA